jgi:hypothetical protein
MYNKVLCITRYYLKNGTNEALRETDLLFILFMVRAKILNVGAS